MDDRELLEKKLACQTVAQGAFLTWERWDAELPNGHTATRDIIRHPGAAAVVVVDEQKRICMVRQYRMPLERVTWEIPAGKLDPGEEPEVCAVRELSEETGMEAGKVELLTVLATTPGFCDEKIYIYLATDLRRCAAHTDEDEFLSVYYRPFDEVVQDVVCGRINDGKTIAGVLIAGKKLGYL